MSRAAYLLISSATFLAAVSIHVASYFRDMPRSFLSGAWIAAGVLCVPLVVLFVRLKKESSAEQVWQRFWNTVIECCPRCIWGCMSVAWLAAMLEFVRSIFGYGSAPMVFQTAIVLIPISAALSYSVTLVRR
jgi:hypothetical protein